MSESEEFNKRAKVWQKQIEDIAIEMFKEKSIDNLAICVDIMPMVKEFTKIVEQIDFAKNSKSDKYILVPGNRKNEE